MECWGLRDLFRGEDSGTKGPSKSARTGKAGSRVTRLDVLGRVSKDGWCRSVSGPYVCMSAWWWSALGRSQGDVKCDVQVSRP